MSNTKLNKNQVGSGIWTSDNLIAGTNINITPVLQPIIDTNTLGLWHLDDSTGANVITSGDYASTVLYNSILVFTTSNKKFGDGSAVVNRTGYSTVNIFTISDTVASSNFTIDFWARTHTYTYSPTHSINFNFGLSTTITFSVAGKTISVTGGSSAVAVEQGTWHHLALERYNNMLYCYIDGNVIANSSTSQTAAFAFSVYRDSNYANDCCIDEFRLSNTSRYQGQNFTPFDRPYSYGGDPIYQINNTQEAGGTVDQTYDSASTNAQSGTAVAEAVAPCLQNTATGTNSLTISGATSTSARNAVNIGKNASVGDYGVVIGSGISSSQTGTVCIGEGTQATSSYGIALGRNAYSNGSNAIAIGGSNTNNSTTGTKAASTNSIAIGTTSRVTSEAQNAIQLGTGTNSTASTFQVFNTTVLNASGKVPLGTLPIVQCTQAEYDALVQAGTVDSDTLYIITPAS